MVRNNVSRDNIGAGLWTDWESTHVLYEGNWVDGNTGPGIFHEASYDAVIRGNFVARNGFRRRLDRRSRHPCQLIAQRRDH